MATIPLPNGGGTPAPPKAAPLAPVPVARITMRPERLAGMAADAYRQPTMPRDMFAGDTLAAEAWAKAVQATGQTLGALSEELSRVRNIRDINDADLTMRQAFADYRNGIKPGTDPATWADGWSKVGTRLLESIEQNKALSPVAREQIQMRMGRFLTDSQIDLSTDAVRETLRQTQAGLKLRVQQQVDDGDYSGARQTVAGARASLVLPGDEADEMEYGLLKHEKASALDSQIAAEPRRVMEYLKLPEAERPEFLRNLNPAQSREISDRAFTSLRQEAGRLVETGKRMILSGDIRSVEELQDWVKASETDAEGKPSMFLDQSDFDYLKETLEGTAPTNLDADWNRGFRAIQEFPVDAPDHQARKIEVNLREWISRRFEGPMQAEMFQMLDERLKEANSLESEDMAAMAELVEAQVERGALGPIMRPKTNATGQQLAKKEKSMVVPDEVSDSSWYNPWSYGRKKPGGPDDAKEAESMVLLTEEDPEKRAAADLKARVILQQMRQWSQANPGKSRDEKLKKLNELMGGVIGAGEAEAFLQSDGYNPLFGDPRAQAEAMRKMMQRK